MWIVAPVFWLGSLFASELGLLNNERLCGAVSEYVGDNLLASKRS